MAKRELKLETRSSDERDEAQRSLGFVGVSAIAHVGLLIAVLLAPSFKTTVGEITGTEAGTPVEMKSETTSDTTTSANATSSSATTTTEVLLADANDPTAVAMPSQAKPIEEAKAQSLPANAQPPAQPLAKIEKSKAAAPKPAVIEGDVAIDTALSESRKAKQEDQQAEATEVKPVEAKVETSDAPVVAVEEKEKPTEEKTEAVDTDSKATAESNSDAPPTKESTSENEKPVLAEAASTGEKNLPGESTPAAKSSGAGAANTTNSASTNSPGANSAGGGAPKNFSIPLGVPVRDARSLIAMPGNPKPVYPLPDKLAGHQGTAVLIGRVQPDGRIAEVALEKSSGSRLMDESAARAFKGWRYKPGQEGLVRLPVQFQLVGDAKELPAQLHRQ